MRDVIWQGKFRDTDYRVVHSTRPEGSVLFIEHGTGEDRLGDIRWEDVQHAETQAEVLSSVVKDQQRQLAESANREAQLLKDAGVVNYD